jgi:hypothetical protein
MMSKPTPGLWDVKPCISGGGLLRRHGSKDQVSIQIVPIEDANIMAASKDLLEALETLLSNWPEGRDGMDYEGPLPVGVIRCRQAIAKAKGE